MDRRVFDGSRGIGTVRTAIDMYRERFLNGSSSMKKQDIDLPEKPQSKAGELLVAKRDMDRYEESKRTAESTKVQAESELLEAKKTVKDLAALTEESNSKIKARVRDVEKLKKSSRGESESLAVGSAASHHYAEVMKELESMKQELSKLNLDMASVLEEKTLAEKEIEGSCSKLGSRLNSVEALQKELEVVNEEQLLVELAQIEATKEFGEIEAQRKKEASEYSSSMEKTRKQIKDLNDEIDRIKELESKLDATLVDVDVLHNELKLAKEMDKKARRNDSSTCLEDSLQKDKELKDVTSLRTIAEELEAAKIELASAKEGGFQSMASMDIIRTELKHVAKETGRLNKAKDKADVAVQNLNSKLLRAKSKLQSATADEENAEAVLSNLSVTLQKLKTDAEVARKDKKLIDEETANVKIEIQETQSKIDLTEEKLLAAIQELEVVRTSERLALENLRNLIENTMRSRAAASQSNSTINISKFEYEYLTEHAAAAEEIADKKIAASQAWIEALKTSENEILLKMEMAQREMRAARLEEEQEVFRTENTISAKKAVESELRKWKYAKADGAWIPSRRAKHRNSSSPAFRTTTTISPRSAFMAIRKKKVAPNLGKFFRGKRINKNL